MDNILTPTTRADLLSQPHNIMNFSAGFSLSKLRTSKQTSPKHKNDDYVPTNKKYSLQKNQTFRRGQLAEVQNRNQGFFFSSQPLNHGRYTAEVGMKKKNLKDFIAYSDGRESKGYQIDTVTPIQRMIEKVKMRKSIKQTTEMNLRETKRNAAHKINQSLKFKSEKSKYMNINISTADNSLEQNSHPCTANISTSFLASKENSNDCSQFVARHSTQTPYNLLNRDTLDYQQDHKMSPPKVMHSLSPLNSSQFNTGFKFKLLPGQENTLKSKLLEKKYRSSIQSANTSMNRQEIEPSQYDLARKVMKEEKNSQIKYEIKEKVFTRVIPEQELENEISTKFKEVIEFNKGKQVFSAFSSSQRFRNYKTSRAMEDFSLIDANSLITNKNVQPFFSKQQGRNNLFLTPDQIRILDEEKVKADKKLQRAQQLREILRDNEKKYSMVGTFKLSFHHDEHQNVKDLKPFMRDIIQIIKTHTDEAKLSHFDANKFRNVQDVNFNDLM